MQPIEFEPAGRICLTLQNSLSLVLRKRQLREWNRYAVFIDRGHEQNLISRRPGLAACETGAFAMNWRTSGPLFFSGLWHLRSKRGQFYRVENRKKRPQSQQALSENHAHKPVFSSE